jgi:hypothetical protein
MQLSLINIDIKHLFDYQVVDIHLIYICNIMKVELLHLDTVITPTLMFKSVMEIRIIYTLQGTS